MSSREYVFIFFSGSEYKRLIACSNESATISRCSILFRARRSLRIGYCNSGAIERSGGCLRFDSEQTARDISNPGNIYSGHSGTARRLYRYFPLQHHRRRMAVKYLHIFGRKILELIVLAMDAACVSTRILAAVSGYRWWQVLKKTNVSSVD